MGKVPEKGVRGEALAMVISMSYVLLLCIPLLHIHQFTNIQKIASEFK